MVPDSSVPRIMNRGRSAAVDRYFARTAPPEWPVSAIAAFIMGLALVVLGFAAATGSMKIVFLVAGAGLFAVWWSRYNTYLEQRPPTDAEMDALLRHDVEAIAETAAAELQLDVASSSGMGAVTVKAAVDLPADGEHLRARLGADGKLRADAYDVFVLLLTPEVLVTCECRLDLATGDRFIGATRTNYYHNVGLREDWRILGHEDGFDPEIARRKVLVMEVPGGSCTMKLGEYSDDTRSCVIRVAWPNQDALQTLYQKHRGYRR